MSVDPLEPLSSAARPQLPVKHTTSNYRLQIVSHWEKIFRKI